MFFWKAQIPRFCFFFHVFCLFPFYQQVLAPGFFACVCRFAILFTRSKRFSVYNGVFQNLILVTVFSTGFSEDTSLFWPFGDGSHEFGVVLA